MPAYITLYKFTPQGLATIKQLPDRVKAAKALAEKTGGRTIGVWMTLGEYDLVAVSEGPDDQAAALATLGIAMQGNVTSVTMKAFSEEEFAQIVGRLP
jgi:uncharacterized protein with GYD domain